MARSYDREALEFARAVTFFDAIFAFAVTLLITTVDDFAPEAWSSPSALWAANGPALLAFTISFLVVVSYWRANHSMMAGFRALNSRIITLNVAFMFGVVLLPFVTEALGQRAGAQPLAVAAYAVVLSYLAIVQSLIYLTADRLGLLRIRLTPAQRRRRIAGALPVPLVFLASIPIAYWFGSSNAQWSWISLIAVGPLVDRVSDAVWGPESRIPGDDDEDWVDLSGDPQGPSDDGRSDDRPDDRT